MKNKKKKKNHFKLVEFCDHTITHIKSKVFNQQTLFERDAPIAGNAAFEQQTQSLDELRRLVCVVACEMIERRNSQRFRFRFCCRLEAIGECARVQAARVHLNETHNAANNK